MASDQRNTMYCRPRDPERSDPKILEIGRKHYGVKQFANTPGYTMRDWAVAMANWYLERWWGFGNMVGNEGLFTWFPDEGQRPLRDRMKLEEKWTVSDPEEMSRNIKKAAIFLGASLVGIWYIHPEKCLGFWGKNNGSCTNCISVCPHNKLPGKVHDAVRYFVQRVPWLHHLFVELDKLLGYGKKIRTEDIWN
jgi:ferredoxin